ncbi:MAG: ABC transporter permease [Oscillospiraceae bacterium]
MKFIKLLQKELRELLTKQMLVTLVLTVGLFLFIGNLTGDAVDDAEAKAGEITLCDQDNTAFTKDVVDLLKAAADETDAEISVRVVDLQSDDYVAEMNRLELTDLVIIPKGFTATIDAGKQAQVNYVSVMTSLSAISGSSAGSSAALQTLSYYVKAQLYDDKIAENKLTQADVNLLEDPVTTVETTIVGDKSAAISANILLSISKAQGMFVPIVVYILVLFAAQMIIAAISNEKIDKTLETLLSAPVSRLSVLSAKMLAAAIISGLNAAVYMVGLSKMMDSMTGGALEDENTRDVIKQLGMQLSGSDYVLLGMQMFLTILIALSVSLVLGALAKDVKSAQALIMPIMILAMIPYLLSMMVDIKTLSPLLRTLIYAIPFTHTFMAGENIMFGHMTLYWGGLVYQVVLLAVCMTLAVRVFMTDKIFTMTIEFGKKRGAQQKKSLLGMFKK